MRICCEALLAHIRAIHAEVKGEYGWPTVWKELLARGIRVGKQRVQRLMRAHGIKARGKRKFVVTTDSKHGLPVTENLLARDVTPAAPDRVWSSDITYIATDEGWLYLAVVIDWLTFYNHRRLHSTLTHVSPMQFEEHWHAGQPKQAARSAGYGMRQTRARSLDSRMAGAHAQKRPISN